MRLSQRHVDIVEALYGLNIDLARGDDNQRRQLTQKIDEQIAFEFGPRWGMKARAGGNIGNASKDSIAYLEADGTVSVWDWQNGSTREPQVKVNDEPTYPNLPTSEAKFIAVEPVNHLDGEVPDDDDDDEEAALAAILKKIVDNTDQILANQATILQNQARTHELIQLLIDKPLPEFPPVKFPEYKGSVLGFGITLKPQP